MLNHIGTHVDAPAHQIAGGDTLDEIGLDRLVTDALTIDVSAPQPARGDAPGRARAAARRRCRRATSCCCIPTTRGTTDTDAYWTGWSYPDADAARALIERGISAIGFDGPSADPVDTTTFELHRIWLGAGRMILENVANLDRLPERAQVVVAPMKVARANGAPARDLRPAPD